ncbi:hypothetical protein ACWPKO_23525 (plasmid) [Coraliomargarita sp. W4R53]
MAHRAQPSSPYNPLIPQDTWAEVMPFVIEAVSARCGHMTKRGTDEYKRTLAYFGDWVVQTRMVALVDALTPDVIDVYTEDRKQEVIPVMAERERKMLRELAGMPRSVERRTVSTSSEPERPYSEAELGMFQTWASHQRSEYQRIGCMAVFAFGVGCGLTASETLSIRGTDIFQVAGVFAVRVPRDGRVVPSTDRWQHYLKRVAENAPSGIIVAPDASDRKSAMRTVLRYSSGQCKPTPARLRVTWLVAHLEAGTPLAALLPASGMTSTDSLRRAMSFVRPMTAERSLAALRMQETGR